MKCSDCEMKTSLKSIHLFLLLSSLLLLGCTGRTPVKEIKEQSTSPSTATIAASPLPVTLSPSPSPPAPTSTQLPFYQLLWIYQTGGAIWGTALISNGIAYVGSDDGNLYALEARTGDLKWKFHTGGLVRSRPVIFNGLIYFSSDDGYLYAVNAQSAQQVWRVDIGNFSDQVKRENPGTNPDPTGFDYLQSSPVVYEDQVYIGSADGNVYALKAASGQISWTFKTGQKVRATPIIDNGILYIGSWDGTVYALDAKTGRGNWQIPIGGQIQTTALVCNGLVYTASRKASVVALDAQTGRLIWEFDYGHNNWVESSPVLDGKLIYIGSSGNQYIVGLNSESGELNTEYLDYVFYWSTPVITGKELYIGAEANTKTSPKGGLYGFELPSQVNFEGQSPIRLKWKFTLTDTLMPDGNWAGVAASPVISDHVIYFGGLDGKFYAIFLIN